MRTRQCLMLSADIAHVLYRRNQGSLPATRTTDIPECGQSQGAMKLKQPCLMRQLQGAQIVPFEFPSEVAEATWRAILHARFLASTGSRDWREGVLREVLIPTFPLFVCAALERLRGAVGVLCLLGQRLRCVGISAYPSLVGRLRLEPGYSRTANASDSSLLPMHTKSISGMLVRARG